jgi:hypothetical protein
MEVPAPLLKEEREQTQRYKRLARIIPFELGVASHSPEAVSWTGW